MDGSSQHPRRARRFPPSSHPRCGYVEITYGCTEAYSAEQKETASAEDGYFAIAIIANTTRLVIWSDVVHGTKGEAQEKLSKEIRSRNNRSINLRHSRSDRFSPRGPTRMETQAEAYQQIQNWREACLQKASHK